MKKLTLRNKLAAGLCAASLLAATPVAVNAATLNVYTNDFESYSTTAPSLDDTTDADPVGIEWNIADDNALSPTTAGAGVQVISWLTNSAGGANQALLLRPGTEAQVHFRGPLSGSKYTWDFNVYVVREAASDRNFYVVLRGMGSDINGDDYLAYRVDRATGSTVLYYYDGVGEGSAPVAGAWKAAGANQATDRWQHHRIVIDPNAMTFNLFVDDMVTPVLTGGDLSRCEVGVPTLLRIINEGNSANDGYFAIDDITFVAEGAVDLSSTITEGFESYAARVNPDDDADPQGPWITTEVDGTGTGRLRAPGKVQVVDGGVVPAHSGSKSLKVEAGQRAGSSLAWGVPPQADVQVTWWARVPASVDNTVALYTRMSLYGVENNNSVSGDSALLGFGSRQNGTGRATSLLYYLLGIGWVDSRVDYTPDTWEEYRLITHTAQRQYSIIKNPSSANPQLVVDRAALGMDTSPAPTSYGPMFMAAWSSSNGTNHPPAFVDDIEVKSLVSTVEPLPFPYTVEMPGKRFTNVTILPLPGLLAGSVAVDPRDNSTILFTIDAGSGGTIRKATKVASGTWAVDPTPVVTNLANPSGMTIAPDGTIWWVHDFTQALMRLKAPWESNTPERVIQDFGVLSVTNTVQDDDPFDVCIAPASFTGSKGAPGQVIIAERGLDANAYNALTWVDPVTTTLNQTNYNNYIVAPDQSALGSQDLVAMTTLPLSGEIVTLCLDGQISAVNGDGIVRFWWPTIYADPLVAITPAAIATDPTSGRLWIADDRFDQVWSVPADNPGSDTLELAFPLTNTNRFERQMDFHEPGMVFAPNGSFLALTDGSVANDGGRLLVFHNEAKALPTFSVVGAKVANGFQISWANTGASKYVVLRGTDVADPMSFVDISGEIIATSFIDTDTVSGVKFYRVLAKP